MTTKGVFMTKRILLAGIFFSVINISHATESTMNFSGTLVRGTCLINNGQAIDVDFGDMTGNITAINAGVFSNRFQKEITYTVSCSGGIQNNALKIKVDGGLASGNVANTYGNVLATSKSDLGIILTKISDQYVGDAGIKLGEWNNFEYPNLMKIWATPVALESGAVLGRVSGGEFTASATMQVAYQ